MTFVFGGIVIISDGEVLDTTDTVISGLFAAGNVTGGLFYDNHLSVFVLANAAVYG